MVAECVSIQPVAVVFYLQTLTTPHILWKISAAGKAKALFNPNHHHRHLQPPLFQFLTQFSNQKVNVLPSDAQTTPSCVSSYVRANMQMWKTMSIHSAG